MEMFLLSGAMGLQTMQKDVEAKKKRVEAREEKAEAREKANGTNASKIDRALIAMRYGKSEEALQLLEGIEDEDINSRGKIRPITLLGGAVLWNCEDVAQVLIERGADLHLECFDPDPDMEFSEARDQRYGNCTPFGMAIIDKNKEMIKFLVKQGADVNALIRGVTPLQMILSDYSHFSRLGNDYFWRDKLDRDYLQLDKAKYHGIYDDCLRQLPPGQNCLLLDDEGLKIINDCCSKNILKEMQFLIKNGADVNAKDEDGDTVLHYLAICFTNGRPFDFKFIDVLFEAGADPRIANNQGELPSQKFKLLDYVAERFPERMKNYNELMDKFQQRIDELNAQNT
jgi:ankyrin repeat protein